MSYDPSKSFIYQFVHYEALRNYKEWNDEALRPILDAVLDEFGTAAGQFLIASEFTVHGKQSIPSLLQMQLKFQHFFTALARLPDEDDFAMKYRYDTEIAEPVNRYFQDQPLPPLQFHHNHWEEVYSVGRDLEHILYVSFRRLLLNYTGIDHLS